MVVRLFNHVCEGCERLMLKEDIAQDLAIKSDRLYCHECANDLSVKCERCDDRIAFSQVHDRCGSTLCGDCVYD